MKFKKEPIISMIEIKSGNKGWREIFFIKKCYFVKKKFPKK